MKQPPPLAATSLIGVLALVLTMASGCANDPMCPQGTSREGGRCTIPGAPEGLVPEVTVGAGEVDAAQADSLPSDTGTDTTPPDGGSLDGSAGGDALQEDSTDRAPGDATGGGDGDGAVGWLGEPPPFGADRTHAMAVAGDDGATRGDGTHEHEEQVGTARIGDRLEDPARALRHGAPLPRVCDRLPEQPGADWRRGPDATASRRGLRDPGEPTFDREARVAPGDTGPPPAVVRWARRTAPPIHVAPSYAVRAAVG